LAHLLGFKPSAVAFLLHKLPPANLYASYTIPKKSGGVRQIDVPIPQLKKLQRHLANILGDCDKAIREAYDNRRPLAHGFRAGCSIMTNSHIHRCRRYVFNLDLEDFFPSINFGRVRGFLIKNKHFQLDPAVATAIAQIACHNNSLPQGSPCSPIISNLVTNFLDIRLAKLAKSAGCTYSRYADDLTFSTNSKTFPDAIATVGNSPQTWLVGAELKKTIEDAGFAINPSKTRMHFRPSRQLVTGLVVNKKVNVKPEYWRSARAMCQRLFKSGSYFRPSIYPDLPPNNGADPPPITTLMQLEGILNHIANVRSFADPRPPQEKRNAPIAAMRLYRRFLHFKHFAALNRPLVICEGKTDSIYLKCALQSLAADFPNLVDLSGDKPQYAMRFLRPSRVVHEVMRLGSGSSDLHMLIRNYSKYLQGFAVPIQHPVILLVDNDDGAKEIFGALKAAAKLDVSLTSKDDFYYVCRNLYVVKTPEKMIGGKSCIEDLFPSKILATKLGDKSFNLKKEHDSPDEYGKQAFAEKVVVPNCGTIDFKHFKPLLKRFESVIADYQAKAAGQFPATASNS
jgi:retron-type reverse transcriptase